MHLLLFKNVHQNVYWYQTCCPSLTFLLWEGDSGGFSVPIFEGCCHTLDDVEGRSVLLTVDTASYET